MSETDRTEETPPEADAAQPEAAPEDTEKRPAEGADEAEAAEPEPRDYEAEIAALNDRLLRTLAEGENQRRRWQREREETSKYAVTDFARDLLAVADNLRRALESVPDGADAANEALASLAEGVALTERELLAIFERHGVEKIEAHGRKFDHNLHEALFEAPAGNAAHGTVVQVVQEGYVLRGRLLRAARVGVAKAPPVPPPGETETTPEAPAAAEEG